MLVSKTLPGLWNGISQQPVTQRLETMAEAQENCHGTLVDGLMRRPNSELVEVISSTNIEPGTFIHPINKSDTEKYFVCVTADATTPVEIYNADGDLMTLDYGTLSGTTFTATAAVKNYLNDVHTANPNIRFRALTIGTITFVINRNIAVAMGSATVGGSLTGKVQSFLKLPTSGMADGDVYEIVGDSDSGFDNYYVKWIAADSIWEETVKPGVQYQLDASKMPVGIIRPGDWGITSTKDFLIIRPNWGERTVGDTISAPDPSFVGSYINNAFFFKNRLGFLSDDNAIFSSAGDYYNFFPTTSLDILDDAPIDVTISANTVETLQSSAQYNKTLLIFGNRNQFDVGSGDSALTPKTISVTPTTQYDVAQDSLPVTSGSNVYFITPNENYGAVREYYLEADTLTNEAADVTAHVTKYIPTGFYQLASINALDVIFLHTKGDPNSLYVYKYFWAGNEKAQASWSKWTLGDEVIGITTVDTSLYAFVYREKATGNVVTLERIRMEDITHDCGYRIALDGLFAVTPSLSGDDTLFPKPWTDGEVHDWKVVDPTTGLEVEVVQEDDDNMKVASQDLTGKAYYMGFPFESSYRFSEWILKDDNNRPMLDGRLQIRKLVLDFVDTGYFEVQVTPSNRDTVSQVASEEFTGAMVGVSTIGETDLISGKHSFTVRGKNRNTQVEIVSDSHLPFKIQTGTWIGMYNTFVKGRM